MRHLHQGLFGRLVLGLVLVSLCAVGVATLFLYTRFHGPHSLFYEGTLQGFAADILKDVTDGDGKLRAQVSEETRRRIAEAGGRFILLDIDGQKLAGSPEVTDPFIAFDPTSLSYFYFRLPASGTQPELFGLTGRIPNISSFAALQIVFPSGDIIFESVLHEFMKKIAWLWIPFLGLFLLTNIVVARLALRPLAQAVEQARAIQPGGVAVLLSEKGLPHDLLALVRTVNEAFIRLRQAYQLQEEFVADVAHELRTPLSVMKAQLAALDVPQARLLETDLGGMERLVEQMLDRARLGRFRIEPGDVVDLRDVGRETAAFLAPQIVARGRLIEVVAGDQPVIVSGGRDDIFRAVRNLIENALEHSPANGTISVEITNVPAIAVRDCGPGFPAQVLDAEWRRSGLVRSDRRDGAGLGLSIVERTMLAHGGELNLSNAPGGGCAEMRFPPAKKLIAHVS
ncbi:HAMP domain-containing sensor histidine kinase [Bradyrhizobium sp. SZCCHNRI1003]|uniref:sensor histidine kinase n=1 Tax=Bradyrhizobium sp. SZCCHNRI1003 TaxID=3057275 RepID=UPI002916520A|nr:HAMP domain-containing sensor histidine kinase [Bradyrhizobium sp. SZCCHNRI1003]